MKLKTASLITFLIVIGLKSYSQIKIISSSFSSYNVSPESMCGINYSNNSNEVSAIIIARIINIQGAEVVKVISNPLILKKGVFNTLQSGLKISSTNYLNTSVSEFVKLYHQLPSGKYNYCVTIKINDAPEDELCDDIESENSSYLTLINPIDKDTIETLNPVLIWNHSESFNILQQGEYFRMVVTEIKGDQGAESAINTNNPLLQQNFLNKHNVLYPFDAPKLVSGGRYAWQVQKLVNGVITNKTEAWEFILKAKRTPVKIVVEITPKLNVSPYVVVDDKIYFVFKEEYVSSDQKLNAMILSEDGKEVKLESNGKTSSASVTQTGPNRYEVDLRGLGLKEGYYNLNVLNEKKQTFLLKFKIQ